MPAVAACLKQKADERGSALMLFPAAMLIIIVLAAMTVDASIAFLGERDAAALATAAANDAATAINETSFRTDGTIRLDELRARRVVAASIAGSSTELENLQIGVSFPMVNGTTAIRVTVTGTIDIIFAKALPGAADAVTVSSTVTATLQSDP